MKAVVISAIIFLSLGTFLFSQDTLSLDESTGKSKEKVLSGFIRGGFYSWIDKTDNKPYVSSAFSDLGLRLETRNNNNFRAFSDLRFRYGSEFLKPVTKFDLREAYVTVNGKKWELSAGQKIIKWGRCDFTNPTSKLNPMNMISRSPDREDIDMGNLLAAAIIYPLSNIKLEGIVIPYYRPSVLIIEPVPLPENVTINQLSSILTDKKMFSYALKADFRLKGFDWSFSWFDGYDPLPGIALTDFQLDLSQPIPVPHTELTVKPYRNRMAGFDFETTAGGIGIRGEAAVTIPDLSHATNEYVPFPEIKWAAGFDWSSGIWRFTGEYSGKYILDFSPSIIDPLIGTEPDYAQLAELLAIPGFDLNEYVRLQVGAFNRLYNYQLKETYHSAAFRAETEMAYGKVLPSVMGMFNFTTRDLLVIPEIKIKPADGLSIAIGAEIYSGRSGSLYDLIDDFMNGAYLSLRVDF
jgi:hypothetical protein